MNRARYCFGGAVAVRLGSTGSVNTIVVAHPGHVKQSQIEAIKVTNFLTQWFHLEVLSTYDPRFPRLGYWLKVMPNESRVTALC